MRLLLGAGVKFASLSALLFLPLFFPSLASEASSQESRDLGHSASVLDGEARSALANGNPT